VASGNRLNKVHVRQLIADALIAWMKWQIGKGSKKWFDESVGALAATLESGEGPQFKSQVWSQALRITDRWNQKRKVPYQMMRRLLTIYEDTFW
jgi:hypothetical protein